MSEYNHPDSRLHDVWVMDGLAYSAEWENGLVVVDVGHGGWGGSPENPVFVSSYPLPTGGTHAVFPYISESTGKHYVFVGDEIMSRRGLAWEGPGQGRGSYQLPYDPDTGMHGIPLATQGYIQIIDFSDPEAPEMVARYEVPEYGTHNIWVEDDILYQAYYEGGRAHGGRFGGADGEPVHAGARDRGLQGLRPGWLRAQFADGVERHALQGADLLLGHELGAVVGAAGAA